MSGDSVGFVAALDVGTTTVRCQILNSRTERVGYAQANVQLHYPIPGHVEINPDELWLLITKVIKQAITNANISIRDVISLGISTQRATFTTWRKSTGAVLHNFITWKDIRVKALVKQTNSSWSVWMLRWGSYLIHFITRLKKFLIASRLRFSSNHVTIRLLWVLNNLPEVKKALQEGDLMFGTLETWLVYRLTKGKTYASDISNASATGLFDPFNFEWSIINDILNIPKCILPPVVPNDFSFGAVDKEILGAEIPISCVMADQSSSMFGSCCFLENDLKVTLGTGAFLNVNTAQEVQTSLGGMYPLVGWQFDNKYTYISEVPSNDAGSLIQWALGIEIVNNVNEIEQIVNGVEDTDGVYFIAAFSGLGPPINNEKAGSGFIGTKPTTKKAHLLRAIIESIVFRVVLTYRMLKQERNVNYKSIRVDGGVSNSDFICQMLADLTDLKVERSNTTELSILGVGFLAGLNCGLWKDIKQLEGFRIVEKTFLPQTNRDYKKKLNLELDNWIRAAKRFMSWY